MQSHAFAFDPFTHRLRCVDCAHTEPEPMILAMERAADRPLLWAWMPNQHAERAGRLACVGTLNA